MEKHFGGHIQIQTYSNLTLCFLEFQWIDRVFAEIRAEHRRRAAASEDQSEDDEQEESEEEEEECI